MLNDVVYQNLHDFASECKVPLWNLIYDDDVAVGVEVFIWVLQF